MRLTDISVRNLKAPDRGVKVYSDDTLAGFGIRLSQGGSRAWVLTLPGAARQRVTLGKVGVLGLADARHVARRKLAELTLGRHQAKRTMFLHALEIFLETRKQRNRPKTAYETERLLRRYFRPLHNMQLDTIRGHHVSDITDALSKQGLQSTAAHAHTAAHTFLKFCAQRHYIPFNPIAEMEKPTLPKSRERVLTDDELRAVWGAADVTDYPFGRIVQLLILTGQRRGETSSIRASWLDLEKRTCTIPAEYAKNRKSHTFPIGSTSASILSSRLSGSDAFVFSAGGSGGGKPFNGWSKAKAQLDNKVAEIHGTPISFTLHDLRRTWAVCLQRLQVKPEVIEELLGHVSHKGGVLGIYQRYTYWDEQVDAVNQFESWFITNIIG